MFNQKFVVTPKTVSADTQNNNCSTTLNLRFEATRDGIIKATNLESTASPEEMLRALFEEKRALSYHQVMEMLGIPDNVYNKIFLDDRKHPTRLLRNNSTTRWHLRSFKDWFGNDRYLLPWQKKARLLLARYLDGEHLNDTMKEIMNRYYEGGDCESLFRDYDLLMSKFRIREDEIIDVLQEYDSSHTINEKACTITYSHVG